MGIKKLLVITAYILIGYQVAVAKDLYRYQDKNGKWSFRDSPPKSSEVAPGSHVKHAPLKASQNNSKLYYLQNKTADNAYQIKFVNGYDRPVEVNLKPDGLRNCTSQPQLPRTFVLKAGEKRHVTTIWPEDKRKPFGFSLTHTHTLR